MCCIRCVFTLVPLGLLCFELLVTNCCLKLCPESVMASNSKPQTPKANTTPSTTKNPTNQHQNTQNTASPTLVWFPKSHESTNNQKSLFNSHLDPKQQPPPKHNRNSVCVFVCVCIYIYIPACFVCLG